MELRAERPEDEPAVAALHAAAFGDHGAVVTALLVDLRATLRPGRDVSLVAEDAGEVVGHVMTTRSLLDAPRRLVDVAVLSPLAVRPDRQGRGAGSALVRRTPEILASGADPVVFLEGDPGYYARFGFVPGARHGFRAPSPRIPDAAFQAHLLPAYEAWMTGTLVYSDVFWRHDAVGLRDPDA